MLIKVDKRLSSRQVAILRTCASGGWFDCGNSQKLYKICIGLAGRGLLMRDPVKPEKSRFTASAAGTALIIEHDAELEAKINAKQIGDRAFQATGGLAS